MENGVVHLDVVLLELGAVDGAAGDGDGLASDRGERGAVGHVLKAVCALHNVALDHVLKVGVLHDLHLGLADLLAESHERVVVGGENGDGAGGGHDGLVAGLFWRR